MADMSVRNIPDATHQELKRRAARHGRSTEAEARQILVDAAKPPPGLGSALVAIGREFAGVDFQPSPRRGKINPASFE